MLTLLLISIIVGVLIWLRIPTYDVTLYLPAKMSNPDAILVDNSSAEIVKKRLRKVTIRVSKGSHRIDVKKGSGCITVEQLIDKNDLELNVIDNDVRLCLQSWLF